MYSIVIFDWDGTLCDSASRIVEAMQLAARDCGLPMPDASAIENVIGLGLQESVASLFPGLSVNAYEQIKAAYSDHFIVLDVEPSPMFSGARELLEDLKARDLKIAVATGKSRRGLNRVLAGHGLEDFFDATRCADETRSKPDPLMLEEILAQFGLRASEAVMIGDTEYDLAMAQRLGMPRIGVGYGSHSHTTLQRCKPIAIVEELTELRSYL